MHKDSISRLALLAGYPHRLELKKHFRRSRTLFAQFLSTVSEREQPEALSIHTLANGATDHASGRQRAKVTADSGNITGGLAARHP